MVPHDQQVAVASPGIVREELVLDSTFVINTLATTAHISRGLALPEQRRRGENIVGKSLP